MSRRPTTLTMISFFYVLIAVSLPAQIFFLYEYPLSEIGEALSLLTWLNWAVVIGTLICAFLIYRADPVARYAVPVLLAVVALNNFVVGHVATHYSHVTASMATVAFAALNLPLLRKSVRVLFVRPDQRWWRTAPRYSMRLPLFIGRQLHSKAETFDISESGMFILGPTNEAELEDLNVDEVIPIHLYLGFETSVSCKGRVVRQTPARGRYPAGYGVQFVDMPKAQRRQLRRYLHQYNSHLTM